MRDGYPRRELARVAIRAGLLPSRAGDQTRNTRGSGCECALCGETILSEEIEVQIACVTNPASGVEVFHLHAVCWSAWECERVKLGC
jgi:hypothetical protein